MNMKTLFCLTILLISGTAFSQTSLKEGAKVNGIGLGATREEIIRRFGKPTSQSKKEADPCVSGTELTLNYPGLTFKLWNDLDDKFTVGYFEVRSAGWNVSGAQIGQSSAAIKKRLGTRTSQEIDGQTNMLTWYYHMGDDNGPGSTNFAFRRGKVSRIVVIALMC